MKLLLAFCIFSAIAYQTASGQDSLSENEQTKKEFLFYKQLYRSADSLKGLPKQPALIEKQTFTIADSLDKVRPQSYFVKAAMLLAKGKYNDASFIFYLGKLRFRYYNSANPDYDPSNDGALLTSFEYSLGEPLSSYLQVDIENYIAILKASFDWVSSNDYTYFPKSKSPEKYADQLNGIRGLIADLQNNKEKYTINWAKQRTDFEKNIDTYIDTINKVGKEKQQ